MALNFPSSPVDEEIYVGEGKSFKWSATDSIWYAEGGLNGGASVTVSDDPPVSPVIGHFWYATDADVGLYVYTDDGSSTQWVQTNGGGGGGGVTEIVDADTAAGWQVWGDVMIQWGTEPSAESRVVTFEKAFKTTPSVTAVANSASVGRIVGVASVTATSCEIFNWKSSDSTAAPNGVMWLAIGEALDADKKPKTVQTIGGTDLQEFHDPAGLASWRIVGTTLEVWGSGTAAGNGLLTVPFPKTFARVPNIQATPAHTTQRGAMLDTNTPATVSECTLYAFVPTSGNDAPIEITYHITGEWDGT
tara:strand:+ start:3324 stop:4235 length:912 start_codon:yes stop_codon:yes gene_type:complete